MTKEFVFSLPHGVKIIDNVLYFGEHMVIYHDKQPYKFANPEKMCTRFAIRYTNDRTSYPTLCTTLDIVPMGDNKSFVWLCGVTLPDRSYLPSAYYSDWESVEYILKNFAKELEGSEWFICIDDDDYIWDDETGFVRKRMTIETVSYEWDD